MSTQASALPAPSAEFRVQSRALQLAGIVAFAALVALGARISVPLGPVPMTLQVPFVLLAGAFLGPWAGAASMALYLGAGALGLPVFAAGGGPAYFLGPTGGYLAGFVPAAAAAGLLAGRRGGFLRLAAAMAAAMVLLHACGLLHLGLLLGRGPAEAAAAVLPALVLPDLLKVGAAAALAASWRGLRGARGGREA
jgi:biotin transport system substrate-specific component